MLPEPQPVAAGEAGLSSDLEVLESIQKRVLSLSTQIVHYANRVRSEEGPKVGGHQASSASVGSRLTALYFHSLRLRDRGAIKPHASLVYHAIQFLLGNLAGELVKQTIYHTFIGRDLDAPAYAAYSESKFIFAGTPIGDYDESGMRSAPVDISPSSGIEMPNVVYNEPCFARELNGSCWPVAKPAGPQALDRPCRVTWRKLILAGERRAPVVTVLDGHSLALSFIGSVFWAHTTCLGVEEFGQPGSRQDLYEHSGIIVSAIYRAAVEAVEAEG